MERINMRHYYTNKLEKVEVLESQSYQELELNQQNYQERINFYQAQKDKIGTKIRMLEVYQELWEDLESQMVGQAFLNEEFWNNITFTIVKYNKFIEELNKIDYNSKAKNALDKKANKELWDQREQAFIGMKNDISYMNSNFIKMHSDIHKRALLQRECIEKHISVMVGKYKEAKAEKEKFRNVFHEIQKDIGAKGNKISKHALMSYKVSLLEKAEYAAMESDMMELDLAW